MENERKFGMRSIKRKMIFWYTMVILIITVTLSFVSIKLISNDLIEGAHSDLTEIAKEEAKYVKSKIDTELKYIDALAKNTVITNEEASIEQKIAFYEGESEKAGYLSFSFADKSGNTITLNDSKQKLNIRDSEFFKKAINGEVNATGLIFDESDGSPVIIFAAPVKSYGKVIGVLYGKRNALELSGFVSDLNYKKTGFSYMVDNEGTSVGDRNTDLVINRVNFVDIAKEDNTMQPLADIMTNSMLKREIGSGEYEYEGNNQIVAYAPIEDSPWIMVVGIIASEVLQEISLIRNVLSMICLIAIVIAFFITYFISNTITKPIIKITKASQQIANGDFDVQLNVDSMDEVGHLAKSFKHTIDKLVNYQGYIDEIGDILQNVANGDLTVEMKMDYTGQFEKLKVNMQALLHNLNNTLLQINQSADQVSNGSEILAGGSQALSQGATEQASAIEELSASILEITGQIKNNAENAKLVSNKAELSGKELQDSNNKMKEMVLAMDQIAGKSSEISKIIKVIDDIAFQTNILALNAAVEAARAGNAGKGFAVVADEVRNLAGKSADAAKDTTALIDETIQAVEMGSRLVKKTAISLEESANSTIEAIPFIDEIAIASNEQAISIEQIRQGIEQVSAVVQTNAATAEESAATSEELSSNSIVLKQLVSNFKLKEN